MSYSCLGFQGERYYFISSGRKQRFLEIKKFNSDEMCKIMHYDEWAAKYPKVNKSGEVYGINWKKAASDLKRECEQKGEYKPTKDQISEIRPPHDAELYRMIGDAINHDNGSALPKFENQYYVIKTDTGEREILKEIGNGVVQYYSEQGLVSDILKYCRTVLYDYEEFDKFTTKHADNAASDWLHSTDTIDKPAMVLTKNQKGLCFHRLPFEPNLDVETPIFDEFISRCSNSMALKCFIGSLFFEEANRQQYLWMWGEGENGKGAIQRFLGKLMGPAYISKVPPKKSGDNFWTSTLLGKRLVALPDCNDPSFPASGIFKMLTGEDQVPIEKKTKDGYSADLKCKFIFGSNETPIITGQKSDIRRALYIEIEPIGKKPDPKYELKLWAEAQGIVAKCIECYQEEVGPNHGTIPVYDDMLQSIVDQNDDEWQALFDKYFETDDRKDVPEFGRWYVTGIQMITLFKKIFKSADYEKKRRQFIKWLGYSKEIRRKSIKIPSTTVDGKEATVDREIVIKGYSGIRRSAVEPFDVDRSGKDIDSHTNEYQ